MHKTAKSVELVAKGEREETQAESFSAVEKLPAWKRIVNPLSLRYFSGKKGGRKRPEQVLEEEANRANS